MPPAHWLCLLLTFLLSATGRAADGPAAKPKPDARYGNVLYRTPDRAAWTLTGQPNRRVFAATVPAGEFCRLTVFGGDKLEGDFTMAFERAVTAVLRELDAGAIERDGRPQASKAMEGFDVLQRVIVARNGARTTCHWFLAGHPGDRFDLIAYQASSEALFQQHHPAAVEFFTSVKLANSLAAPPLLAEARAAAVPRPAVPPRTPSPRFGPLAVGDRVEVPWAGGWTPGTVLNIEGLTYFVHFGAESDGGKYDDFFTLNLLRPPDGPRTYAETFRGTLPDPEGGPLDLGAEVEYENGRWLRARVARRLGERYVLFGDKPGVVTERWVSLDRIRLVGATAALAAARPAAQRQPARTADIRAGDLVEARPRRGFWGALTVLAQNGASYFVKIGPDSGLSLRGWVDLSHMRPVGAKEPFAPEDLKFFVGRWRMSGDSFQNLISRKTSGNRVTETYENNRGAGQDAGAVEIRADGTYVLTATVVFHDGKGRWERNPNQDEGGILLRGADGKGEKDGLMTNHQDGFSYFQGAIRGPGKWCTRIAN